MLPKFEDFLAYRPAHAAYVKASKQLFGEYARAK